MVLILICMKDDVSQAALPRLVPIKESSAGCQLADALHAACWAPAEPSHIEGWYLSNKAMCVSEFSLWLLHREKK